MFLALKFSCEIVTKKIFWRTSIKIRSLFVGNVLGAASRCCDIVTKKIFWRMSIKIRFLYVGSVLAARLPGWLG